MSLRIAAIAAMALLATASIAQAQSGSGIKNRGGKANIDYANALPTPLPQTSKAPITQAQSMQSQVPAPSDELPTFVAGSTGDGRLSEVKLPRSKYVAPEPDGVSSQDYGTSNHPFTTALEKSPQTDPYRRAGKLFFKNAAGESAVCSASLIRRGLVVTAAHCVRDRATDSWNNSFQYVPAYAGGNAPYGVWDWDYAAIPTSYFKETDKCAVKDVVCQTDIAMIAVRPQSERYPGQATGTLGYATGGYSYTSKNQVMITQLGYPVALNGGEQMMRTDSQGFVDAKMAGNTIIGSLQTGGSSGGPWIANFGLGPTPAPGPDGTTLGAAPNRNVVVGTTSWGYTAANVKQQGASFFSKAIFNEVYNNVCNGYPAACQK